MVVDEDERALREARVIVQGRWELRGDDAGADDLERGRSGGAAVHPAHERDRGEQSERADEHVSRVSGYCAKKA